MPGIAPDIQDAKINKTQCRGQESIEQVITTWSMQWRCVHESQQQRPALYPLGEEGPLSPQGYPG